MTPKITVVIGTFNRPRVVNNLLNQLKNIPSIEVIVIDQSDKKIYTELKKNFPKKPNFALHHLANPSGVEFLNLGWQKAKAPIVLYLDDDVEITEQTISAHLRAYENPNAKAVAGRVINDNEQVKEKEPLVGKIQWFGAVIHKNFSSKVKTDSEFPYGCNMSYRKTALEEIGGFDAGLQPPQSYNEVDLGWRINKRWPKSLVFEPEALVYHHRYPSGGGRSYDAKMLAASNAFNYGYFIGKNFNVFENIIWFLRRLPYQIVKEPNAIIPIFLGLLDAKKRFLSHPKGDLKLTWNKNVLTLVLFLVIFLLRFWQVPQRFFFGIDEEYQSLLALSIIKDFHVIWIGLSAANTGFYIAPGFVYLHSFLLWISKLDPIILGYAASVISFITIVIFYFVVKHLFDKKTALITTLIYAFSSFVMSYDRRFWNSTFVPLTVILFFLSLVKSEKNPWWYVVTAILLGVSFHIHASLFIFLPIVFCVLMYRIFIAKQKVPSIIYHLSSIIFLIIYSPLIVFDFVHNFDNLKTPLRMIAQFGKEGRGHSFLQHLQTIQSALQQFWSSDSFSSLVNYSLLILIIIILIWFFFKKKNGVEKLLSLIVLFYASMFLFYPGTLLDYYFIGFFPFFSIVIALFLKEFYRFSLIALVALFILPNSVAFLQSSVDGNLESKKIAIQKTIRTLGNKSFYLETTEPYVYFGGWRYLFEAYGKKPAASQADEMFGWIYPKEISNEKPKIKVLITANPKFQPSQTVIKKITSKSYAVFILGNK
jgi:GT2 family glycosyltransferase